jgi:hypothetical protein
VAKKKVNPIKLRLQSIVTFPEQQLQVNSKSKVLIDAELSLESGAQFNGKLVATLAIPSMQKISVEDDVSLKLESSKHRWKTELPFIVPSGHIAMYVRVEVRTASVGVEVPPPHIDTRNSLGV